MATPVIEKVHPRRGVYYVPVADTAHRDRARALLSKLPPGLPLPVGKGDRVARGVAQEFWGCSREELRLLVQTGEKPME